MGSLHNDIMNIPNEASKHGFNTNREDRIAYQAGHRDARHAAAELANKYDYNHERLVEVAKRVVSIVHPHPSEDTERYREELELVDLARTLLAQLQAGKGGE